MRQAYIYCLKDPRCNSARYVGKTNDPKRRIWDHCSRQANDMMRDWIASLKALKLKPLIEVLESCAMEQWQEREIFWIQKLRSEGNCILNQTKGGNGKGCHSPETVAKMTAYQNSPERREFQAEVGKRGFSDPDYVSKFKAGQKKWSDDPKTKAWQKQRMSDFYKDPVFVAKRNAALRAVNGKPVNKICPSTGEVLQQFPTVGDAAASLPASKLSIFRALDMGRMCKGFFWRYPEGVVYVKKPRCKACNKQLHNCKCHD